MTVGLHGPTLALEPGDEYVNCDPAEAKRLVAAGFAIPIAEIAVERAVAKPVIEQRKKKG